MEGHSVGMPVEARSLREGFKHNYVDVAQQRITDTFWNGGKFKHNYVDVAPNTKNKKSKPLPKGLNATM